MLQYIPILYFPKDYLNHGCLLSILLSYTLDNADSSVVQFFTLWIRRKEKIVGGLTAKRKEKQFAKKKKPHFSKSPEHMPTLHIALYCSGDRMNTPHKEEKKIKENQYY